MLNQVALNDIVTEARDLSDPAQLIRVVICGEVSAGKSTVLNTMMREPHLPDNLGSSSRPVVHVGHGDARLLEITQANGRSEVSTDIQVPRKLQDACRVDLSLDQPHLQGFELIEVPMTTAEDLTETQIELVRSAHVIIWVTIASQAWRLTEKTILETLGDARPTRGILAVSRTDKLRSKRDRERLRERLVRETDMFFDDCVFIRGSRKDIIKSGISQEAWADTGGAKLIELAEMLGQEALAEMPPPEADPVPAMEPEVPAGAMDESVDEAGEGANVVELTRFRSAGDEASEGTALEIKLRTLARDLMPSISLGIVPKDHPESCFVMNGDPESCRAVASVCHDALHTIGGGYVGDPVSGGVFTMGASRLMFRDVSNVGMVFMMSGKDAISYGMAQRTMTKICDTCTAYA